LAIFQNNDKCTEYWKDTKFNADKLLVLFWGGKDSLVSVELLKEKWEDFDLFSFWKNFKLHEVAQEPTW
jgi:tRNA(Ile)-lysidine synthase TilS/MesJ